MAPIKQSLEQNMAEQAKQNRNSDIAILLYRMDELKGQNAELKSLVEAGFVRQEGRVVALETRVAALEIWRASAAEVLKDVSKNASTGSDNLYKIIFIVLGLLGTAFGVLGSGILTK